MDDNANLKQSNAELDNNSNGREESKQNDMPKIPNASFSFFISSLVAQALISLGEVDNPLSKKRDQNLDQAKFTIDTLQIIKDKTVGNLSEDETKLLDTALYDLRMRYVEKSK